MVKVKMKKAGKWAETQPHLPQFEVKEGDVVDVSVELAEIMVTAGAATRVKAAPAKQVKAKQEKSPASKDKEQAEG